MRPCLVARADFLCAEAMPRLRSTTSAAGRSPLASCNALLHSIMPAPVRSLNCLTNCAVISAITPLVGGWGMEVGGWGGLCFHHLLPVPLILGMETTSQERGNHPPTPVPHPL